MIRYIASDLDGTLLLDGAQSLKPEFFDLILKLKAKGVHFIAASGRPYPNLRNVFDPVKDDISYAAENGSLCVHDGQVISRGLIDRDLGLRIIKVSRKIPGCNCMVSCEDHLYTDSKNQDFLDHIKNVVKFDTVIVDDMCEIKDPFIKLAVCDFDGTHETEPFFRKMFQPEIKVVTSGNLWVDFIAPNANKGTAVRDIVEHLGVSREEGVAFGDQYNDIEMLEYAGTGFYMANSAPGVEKYANRMTDSVEKIMRKILETGDI
ncbi:MAG: HAD family hydrolase [Lachnospiraceae bacterium]